MGIFERLAAKNSDEKSQFSLIFAGVITGFVALIWISTIPAQMGNRISLNSSNSDTATTENTQDKKGELSNFLNDAKTQLGNIVQWNQNGDENGGENILDDTSALGQLQSESAQDVPEESLQEIQIPAEVSFGVGDGLVESSTSTNFDNSEDGTGDSVSVPAPKMILIGTTSAKTGE